MRLVHIFILSIGISFIGCYRGTVCGPFDGSLYEKLVGFNYIAGGIYFANPFVNDTLSFSINHIPVFTDKIISPRNDSTAYFVDLIGYCEHIEIKSADDGMAIYYNQNLLMIPIPQDSIMLFSINTNNNENQFILDLKKGKYFFIKKDTTCNIVLSQRSLYTGE